MSTKDTITRKYMGEPNHFADFFNGYIYDGKEVIKAESLSEIDTTNIAVIPYTKGKKNVTVQKYRDIIKKAILMKSDTLYYLFLGIENQTDIHYAMPVRNMLYDALIYNQQIETISKVNRENGVCENNEEFLSGFTSKDKLIPVVTVTVYWGTKPWDGPVTLKDMFVDIDDDTDAFISDYNCNLFSIIDVKELPEYKTDLKELFPLLKARNNSDDLHSLVTNNEAYQNIDPNTAIMMREFADIKLPRKNKEGKYNMCKAILDLEKKNQLIGADKALVEAIKNLMNNTKKSFEEICISMGISKTDMDRYKKMI